MKWQELTLKERKQIYDTIRAENPNVSYLDIKQQFDNIPEYENGLMLHHADQDYINWKKKLPQNLQESYGYNLYGAYKSGAAVKLDERDGYYHLPTRNPQTGEILKYPSHPTFYYGLAKDIELGYYPVVKGGKTYTIKSYENGKEGNPKLPVELGLTPGTPEYFARQQRISGKADVVQPEVHLTPAGYVKDAMSFAENVAEGNLDPQESKSHMLHLKRAMLQHGKLNGWSDDLTQEQIEDFLNDARNRVNSMNKIQYDMYRNKSRFVDRMNNLIPMEFAVPLSVSGLLNYNNKEQSN